MYLRAKFLDITHSKELNVWIVKQVLFTIIWGKRKIFVQTCNMNPVVSASLNKADIRNGFDIADLQILQIFLLFQQPFSICRIISQYIQTEALKCLFKNLINSFHNQFTVLRTDFVYPITHKCQILSRFSSGAESGRTDAVFLLLFIVSVKYLLEGVDTCTRVWAKPHCCSQNVCMDSKAYLQINNFVLQSQQKRVISHLVSGIRKQFELLRIKPWGLDFK